MITQTVTYVCDVTAISVGGHPRTARGPYFRADEMKKLLPIVLKRNFSEIL